MYQWATLIFRGAAWYPPPFAVPSLFYIILSREWNPEPSQLPCVSYTSATTLAGQLHTFCLGSGCIEGGLHDEVLPSPANIRQTLEGDPDVALKNLWPVVPYKSPLIQIKGHQVLLCTLDRKSPEGPMGRQSTILQGCPRAQELHLLNGPCTYLAVVMRGDPEEPYSTA